MIVTPFVCTVIFAAWALSQFERTRWWGLHLGFFGIGWALVNALTALAT